MPKSYSDQLLGFDPTTGLPVRLSTASVDSLITLSLADFALTSGDLNMGSGNATLTSGNLSVSSGDLTVGGDAVVGGKLNVTGSAFVTGDLTVGGDIISRNQVNVTIQDQILDLGLGNTSESAVAGGLTVTMKKAAGFTVKTATEFNGLVITVDSVTGLSAGDIIAVSGAGTTADGYTANNGLFVVDSAVGTSVTIKGSPSASAPFAQNSLVTCSNQNAELYKVDLAVAIFADGSMAFKDANGLAWAEGTFVTGYFPAATESALESNGSYDTSSQTSLQEAYNTRAPSDTSSKITTADGYAIEFALDDGDFVVNSSGSVDVNVSSPVKLQSANESYFKVASNSAVDIDLTFDSSNAGGGYGNIVVNADGYVSIDAGKKISIESAINDPLEVGIEIGVDNVDGRIRIGTAGERDIRMGSISDTSYMAFTSAGGLDLLSGANLNIEASAAGLSQAIKLRANNGGIDISGSSSSDGYVHISSWVDAVDAIFLEAFDGGIKMVAASEGVLVDSAGPVNVSAASGAVLVDAENGVLTLDGDDGVVVQSAASVFVDSGTDMHLQSDGYIRLETTGSGDGYILVKSVVDAVDAIFLEATAGGIKMVAASEGVLVDSAGPVNVSAASGAVLVDAEAGILTLDGHTGLVAQSAASVFVDSGTDMHLQSDGYIRLETTGTSDGYILVDAAANLDMLAANIILDSTTDGYVNILSGTAGILLDSMGAVDVQAAVGNLRLEANDGYIDGYATDGIVLDTDGYMKLTADQYLEFSSPTISFSSTSGNITLDAQGPGNIILDAVGQIQLTSTEEVSVVIGDGYAEAFSIKSDGYNYMIVDTDGYSIVFGDETADQSFDFAGQGVVSMDALYVSKHGKFAEVAAPSHVADHGFVYVKADGSDSELFFKGDHGGSESFEVQITRDGYLNAAALVNSLFTASANVTGGKLLAISGDGTVAHADKALANGKQHVIGIALANANSSQQVLMAAMPGVAVTLPSAISGSPVVGDEVYLGSDGEITLTIPSTTDDIILRVGYVMSSTKVLFQPQVIAFVD